MDRHLWTMRVLLMAGWLAIGLGLWIVYDALPYQPSQDETIAASRAGAAAPRGHGFDQIRAANGALVVAAGLVLFALRALMSWVGLMAAVLQARIEAAAAKMNEPGAGALWR